MWKQQRYPRNWSELAKRCKEQADWQCEHCTVQHGSQRLSKRTGEPYDVRLAAAHLNHDPANPNPSLAALCPTCHGRYDWEHRTRQENVDLERLKHKMQLKQRKPR